MMDDRSQVPRHPLFCSVRLVIAVLVLFCTCLQYSQKIDLSLNIMCMVNHTALQQMSSSVSTGKKLSDGPFVWAKSIQGLLLSTFFWGYLLSQVPGGILASKFGAKWVMGIAMLINGICLLLYKSAAHMHYGLLIFLRFLVGICAGVIFPSVSQIWTKWSPKQDRSFLIGFAVSGSHLGSVFTLPLAGYLCKTKGGWPLLFYIIGLVTLVWVALWAFVYSNSPTTQRCVSAKERAYILANTPKQTDRLSAVKKQKIPWKSIMTSIPCWSQFICHTLLNWGFYTLLTCTPMYMAEVLHFDIKSSGGLSAIPYLLVWITTTGSGFLADKIISEEWMSRTAVRKTANLIGSVIPAASLIGLCFVTDKRAHIGVALLSLGMAAFGVSFGSGFLCVCNDMTQKYASVVFGISNTLGTLPGVISPYITSTITKNQTVQEWRIVFILAAVLWLIGGVQYAVFGSAEPQPFDQENEICLEEAKELRSEAFVKTEKTHKRINVAI